jgi:polynucleotide 5'-hydroxyl-kinase GRC3/NOL9
VQGTCVLWIKQGIISACGGVFSASTTTYRIYAPATHPLPVVKATSTSAEVQLFPLDDGIQAMPFIGQRDIWTPVSLKQSGSLYHVRDHSFKAGSNTAERTNELDTRPWKTLLAEVSTSKPDIPSRIVIRGKRSAGLSNLVQCLVNRLLARQSASSGNHQPVAGVMLLDLDTTLPEFVPPGLASLSYVRSPLFGPPIATLLSASNDSSGQVIRQHFLGDISVDGCAEWHLAAVRELLEFEQKWGATDKGIPVIIKLPEWLGDIGQSAAVSLWQKFAPSNMIYLDINLAAAQVEPWGSLASSAGCRVHQVARQAFDHLPIVREHDLQMQSYFHLQRSNIDKMVWSEIPVLAAKHPRTVLSYSEEAAEIFSIVLLGGQVATEDTYEALSDSLVALVAVASPKNATNEVDGLVSDTTARRIEVPASGIVRTEEGLPRWQSPTGDDRLFPFSAKDSFCLGLAIVQEIDLVNSRISFIAGPELRGQQGIQEQGYQVAVVVPKATPDGRFKADWMHREMYLGRSEARRTDEKAD